MKATCKATCKLPRRTYENGLIYRPKCWPFECICANGYVVQLQCFSDNGQFSDSGEIDSLYMRSLESDDNTRDATDAYIFDSRDEAIAAIVKSGKRFAILEDGNTYPRVLKVRISCIVEGIAFEPTTRDIDGGKKLKGVA